MTTGRSSTMTTEGEVPLPLPFSWVRVRHLNFLVPVERARLKLEGTGLEPCAFFGRFALVSLVFYGYGESGVGAYDEVTVTIVCRPLALPDPRLYLPNLLRRHGRDWTVGAYVLEMPVTIPRARAAGREIWGFPKYETRVPHHLEGTVFRFGIDDPRDGTPILRVRGEEGRVALHRPAFDLVTYSNLAGEIVRTEIEVDARYRMSIPRHVEIAIGPSAHGTALNLRDLGLDRARPLALLSTDDFASRLPEGRPVVRWPTPPLAYAPEAYATHAKRSS